jgi:acetyl esterase/lipase
LKALTYINAIQRRDEQVSRDFFDGRTSHSVWGESAGGQLVNLLALTADRPDLEGASGSLGPSSRVACAVDCCGPTDMMGLADWLTRDGRKALAREKLFGGPPRERQELVRQASVMTSVSRKAAPLLILHGTEDAAVPLRQSEEFYVALKQAGADATFGRVVGAGHGFGGPKVCQRVRTFFDRHLRSQPVEIGDAPIRAAKKD